MWQPRRGFRYGSEAFWLVGFALEGGRPESALDLGTGSGIAALLLGRHGVRTVGIDLRAEWRAGWEQSLAESAPVPVTLRVEEVSASEGPPVDLVVSNPPFFPSASGPSAPDPWKAAARTESASSLATFVGVAVRRARRACFVVPVERGGEVVAAARARGWGATRWVQVGRRRALIEIAPGSGDAVPTLLAQDDPRVGAWVERARGTG